MSPSRWDTLWVVAATGLRSLGRLALGVALVRVAGAEVFASFALLVALEVVAATLTQCLATAPLVTLAPQLGPERAASLHAHVSATAQRWLRAGTLPAAGVAWLATGVAPSLALLFAVACAGVCAVQVEQGWYRARFASHWALLGDVLALGGAGGGLALGAWLGRDPLVALLTGQVLGLGAAWWVMRSPAPSGEVGPALQQRLRGLAKPMLIGSLAYTASSRLYPFMLEWTADVAQVAIFAAALTLSAPVRVGASACAAALRPRLAACDWSRGWPTPLRLCLAGVGAGAWIGAGLAAMGGGWLADAVYDGRLPGVAAVLTTCVLYASAEALGTLCVVGLQVRDGAAGAEQATRLRIACGVVSALTLVPACRWGAGGAYVALLLVELGFLGGVGLALLRGARTVRASSDSQAERDGDNEMTYVRHGTCSRAA